MSTAVYNPTRFILTFAGIDLKASGEDAFFKITQTTPAFESFPGLNGDVTRAQSNDGRVKVELTLLSTDTVQILALRAIHEADKLSKNGSGVAPLVIANLDTAELWTMPEAWITRQPDLEVKGKPGNRVIEFEASKMV